MAVSNIWTKLKAERARKFREEKCRLTSAAGPGLHDAAASVRVEEDVARAGLVDDLAGLAALGPTLPAVPRRRAALL